MVPCVVIAGPPGAGKSSLAAAVAAARGWACLAKDDYKELAFEHLGWRDRAWSRRVSGLAWELLLREAGHLLGAGVPCVLEGNFRAGHAARLRALGALHRARFVEVRCRAAPDVLLTRYRARAASGARHPGHVDAEALPEVEAELAVGAAPVLALGGQVVDYDTTAGFDVQGALARIGAALAGGSGVASAGVRA